MAVLSHPGINFEFVREYGVHEVPRVGGGTVSVVSSPTWEDLAYDLGRINPQADYALTPEAITAAPPPGPDPAAGAELIGGRNEEIRRVSQFVGSTIILGTLTYDHSLPRLAQVFYHGGQVAGRHYKVPLTGFTGPFDSNVRPEESTRLAPDALALICSDLIYHGWQGEHGRPYVDPIDDQVESLLVSSFWAIERQRGPDMAVTEDRFRDPLMNAATRLFNRHPNLREIIMADRLPENSPLAGPFNMIATRT